MVVDRAVLVCVEKLEGLIDLLLLLVGQLGSRIHGGRCGVRAVFGFGGRRCRLCLGHGDMQELVEMDWMEHVGGRSASCESVRRVGWSGHGIEDVARALRDMAGCRGLRVARAT